MVTRLPVCGLLGSWFLTFLLLMLVLVSKVSVKIAANCDTGAAEKK